MSQDDLQRYLPHQDVMNLLSDIDDYFFNKEGYAGTQTQESVASKREEFKDQAKIVTMDTVIFLKDLLDATDSIAAQYTAKGSPLLGPWPNIHNGMKRLMTIVGLLIDPRRGIERGMRLKPFQYKKYVSRTSTDLLTSSFSSPDGGAVPIHVEADRDINTMLALLQQHSHLEALNDSDTPSFFARTRAYWGDLAQLRRDKTSLEAEVAELRQKIEKVEKERDDARAQAYKAGVERDKARAEVAQFKAVHDKERAIKAVAAQAPRR